MNQAVRIWTSDFGDIALPEDFPEKLITRTGWFDGRFKLSRAASDYISAQSGKLMRGEERPGFLAPSFGKWVEDGYGRAN